MTTSQLSKLTLGQQRALFFSLKAQFESGRPMTESEEKTMWNLGSMLWSIGAKLGMKIKSRP